jgi:hypothetical protein
VQRVEIINGVEKGLKGTVLEEKPTNGDEVLVNIDSEYGRINSRFNRTLSYNWKNLSIIEE